MSIEGQLGDNEGGCIIIISCILKERERQQARLAPFVFLSQPEIGHHFLWNRKEKEKEKKRHNYENEVNCSPPSEGETEVGKLLVLRLRQLRHYRVSPL